MEEPTTTAPAKPKKTIKVVKNPLENVEMEQFEVAGVNDKEVSIVRRKIEKGVAKGVEHFVPDLETVQMNDFIALFDPKVIWNWIRRSIRPLCATISRESVKQCGEDEERIVEVYSDLFLKLSRVGETTKSLKMRQNELLALFTTIDTEQEAGALRALQIVKELKEIGVALAAKKVTAEEEDQEEKQNAEAAAKAAPIAA